MKFNTEIPSEKKEAFRYFTYLCNKKQIVEVKKISPTRTIRQNSYLHLILAAFGSHFGYTLEESKQIYKDLNRSIYVYEKRGRVFHRSSAELTKEEMIKTIDFFKEKSLEQGLELPDAEDQAWIMELENQVEKHRMYL